MNAVAIIEAERLPVLVRNAAQRLASAESSAEVLDARDMASAAYDAAKSAARISRAKRAHDEIISTVYRAQADALAIESEAKRRLADEYDAAQERGEVAGSGQYSRSQAEHLPTASDLNLSRKAIHEARQVRDAEAADPGVTRRALDGLIARGEEPTRAALRREIAPPPPKPRVSDTALWVWGRLRDFESKGLISRKLARQIERALARLAMIERRVS